MGAFTMPSLGADMSVGTLVEWLKAPGDTVNHGDIIAVVETDKGAIEVEVFEDGVLEQMLVEPGSKVPVGTELALINGGEEMAPPASKEPSTELAEPPPVEVTPPPDAKVPIAKGLDDGRLRASPAARKLAAERNIDLDAISGSGPGGAIQLSDVEAASIEEPEGGPGPDLSAMRRAIAAAMARSKREIPHYYLTHRFDISPVLEWLESYNADRPPPERLLLGAVLLKAVALALAEFPEFNGHWEDDRFVPSQAIHLGSAIAIRGGGLAAPCIRDTDTLSLAELMAKLRDLVARTRRGTFRSSEISDGTATVSSLGERGVESLLPVIYPPQVAIIGFGSVERRPWVIEDDLAIMPVLTASLAGDHRANDGHRGALLLRRIEALMNEPEAL